MTRSRTRGISGTLQFQRKIHGGEHRRQGPFPGGFFKSGGGNDVGSLLEYGHTETKAGTADRSTRKRSVLGASGFCVR